MTHIPRRRRCIALAACLALLQLGASAATAATIAGQLLDRGGRPADGFELVLENWPGQRPAVARTDYAGVFAYTDVPPGRYAISLNNRSLRTVTVAAGAEPAFQTVRAPIVVALPQLRSDVAAALSRNPAARQTINRAAAATINAGAAAAIDPTAARFLHPGAAATLNAEAARWISVSVARTINAAAAARLSKYGAYWLNPEAAQTITPEGAQWVTGEVARVLNPRRAAAIRTKEQAQALTPALARTPPPEALAR